VLGQHAETGKPRTPFAQSAGPTFLEGIAAVAEGRPARGRGTRVPCSIDSSLHAKEARDRHLRGDAPRRRCRTVVDASCWLKRSLQQAHDSCEPQQSR
jgi:hypothetical protein